MDKLAAKEQPNPTDVYRRMEEIRQRKNEMIEELRALGDETERLAEIWDQFHHEIQKAAEDIGLGIPK